MQDVEYAENTEKSGKREMHTVKPGIWLETLTNVENEKCTLYALLYWEKTEKRGKLDTHAVGLGIWRENLKRQKMRHKHDMTWNMARNTEKCEKMKKKCTVQDLECGENTEKRGRIETHTLGLGLWQINTEKREK